MATPLISICLPNLNTRPFLEERMATILAQTITDWELIICDSYSEDGSWEFFQKFKGDPRIRLYQVPRAGLYAGWNECLCRATGKYIYIATSDDTMSLECLQKLLAPLEQLPEISISVCDFQKIDAHSQPLSCKPRQHEIFLEPWMQTPSIRDGKTEFLLHAGFGSTVWYTMTAVLFRRKLLQRTGLFRTDLGSRADEEWTLRASLASDIAFVPGKLATWRVHAGQLTGNWQSSRRSAKWLYTAIQDVICDDHAGIPESWKCVPHWAELIARQHRAGYLSSFGLFRWELRRNPLGFLNGAYAAALEAPAYLIHQTLHGFGVCPELDVNSLDHTQTLLRAFPSHWPPTPVRNSW